MKQDCCSIAGGFKCAAREFQGVHWVAIGEIHVRLDCVGLRWIALGISGLDQFLE